MANQEMELRPKPTSTVASKKKIADAARLFKMFNHPIRMQLIICLSVGQKGYDSPSALATHLGERLGNVSYHARTLLEAGMIEEHDTTPRRGAIEHHYRLTAAGHEAFGLIQAMYPEVVSGLLQPKGSSE